jgi:hypothetical protein
VTGLVFSGAGSAGGADSVSFGGWTGFLVAVGPPGLGMEVGFGIVSPGRELLSGSPGTSDFGVGTGASPVGTTGASDMPLGLEPFDTAGSAGSVGSGLTGTTVVSDSPLGRRWVRVWNIPIPEAITSKGLLPDWAAEG